MSGTINLEFTLWGPDLSALARKLAAHPAFRKTPPDELKVGDRKLKSRADWAARLEGEPRALCGTWGEYGGTLFSYAPPEIVAARILDFPADPAAVLDLVAGLPFEVASFGVLYPEWQDTYTPPGFAQMQALLGWGCAFRGAGHDRLVSRRWLEAGPWRLWRAAGDLSLVQFHELGLAAEAALAQARPGHGRLGIGENGGYLQDPYHFQSEVRGLYVAAEKKLVIAAADRVTAVQMRDACALRRKRRADTAEPVEVVAYMFLNEELARAQLPELWLRELECWALIDGRPVRLDVDFRPVVERPDWTRR